MADLLTHLTVARIPATFLRDRRIQALWVLGTFLPDFASKGLSRVVGAETDFTEPAHSIAGVLLLSYLASLFVEERLRRAAFAALAGGAFIHLAVDLLKYNLGSGACILFYPLSPRGFELGLVDPDDFVWLLPLNVVVLAALWLLERKRRSVQQ